ncbi:hypothetical protein BASA62_006590 [Batrachochytrium salamandrivorans]|nr:hypothetical protein BASA62_006590 [Batrachochytrium salamandrivorans]
MHSQLVSPRLFALVAIMGQTIEDVGIETDTVFRPQWSDLQPDSPTNTQYDRIAASLARTGQENGQIHEDQHSGFIFTGISDSVGLYQSSTTAPGDGWNNLKGPWMIGNGVNMLAMSILPLRLSSLLPLAPRSILVSMSLSTPSPDCDFLYLSVKSSGGVEDFPPSLQEP